MPEEQENTGETRATRETRETHETHMSLAAARAALTERDTRIAELQAEGEALRTERSDLENAHAGAVLKYLQAQRNLHPGLPADLVKGATVEEIDESVKSGLAVVEAVKSSLAAEARNNRVPAGAPTREVNVDALDSKGKIRLGLQQDKS